jgi:Ca-activated chloride channel family protein
MTFHWPWLLPLLALPAAWLVWYWALQRRRSDVAARLATPALLPNLVTGRPRFTRHLPAFLLVLAALVLLTGVAGPQREVAVPRNQATVMLALDASNSMRRTDVAPTRLDAAKAAAAEFVGRVPDRVRLGIVSFSRSADVRVGPTRDHDAVRRAIAALETKEGTAIGDAIGRALDAGGPALRPRRQAPGRPPLVVLLLSDGRNTYGVHPLAAAERARELGVPIYTVSLGQDQAADPFTLAQVAERTGGRAFTAPSASDLDTVYRGLGSSLGFETETRYLTVAFVAVGAALALASMAASARLGRGIA